MKLLTVGYDGRSATDLISLLKKNGVRAIVDVRLRPERASVGIWVKAKTPDKGMEKLLAAGGIAYRSLPELGNLFLDYPDWRERYQLLLERAGDLLTKRLLEVSEPYCLLCTEKRVEECHRLQIANFLAKTKGYELEHL